MKRHGNGLAAGMLVLLLAASAAASPWATMAADGVPLDGPGGTVSPVPSVVATAAPTFTAISAGREHTCAVFSDGTVRCWGRNDYGELGDSTTTERHAPVAVSGISTATAISVGGAHSCALLADHTIRCWGNNEYGQLGDGTSDFDAHPTPITVVWPTPFTDIAGSMFYSDIVWVYLAGITTGCTATTYCPEGVVTREQMASFLARALHLSGSAPDAFTDDETSIHEPNINLVAREGIATGCGGTKYCPALDVTWGQMAAFLHRAFAP